jgi:hypothetical protein
VDLPPPTEQKIELELTPSEHILYRCFENLIRGTVKRIMEDNEEKKAKRVAACALRLRQFTAHSFIPENQIKVCHILIDLFSSA